MSQNGLKRKGYTKKGTNEKWQAYLLAQMPDPIHPH